MTPLSAFFNSQTRSKPSNYVGEWAGRKSGSYKWFEIQDAVDYWHQFEGEKILWQELSRSGNAFSFLEEPMYLNNTGYLLTGLNTTGLKYLTAVLNHTISLFYLEQVYNKLDDTGWRWFKVAVEKIPVPTASDEFVQSISDLVDIVQYKAKRKMNHKLEEQEISKLIYSAFKLTQADADILERRIASYFK